MATMASLTSELVDLDSTELDKLIHSFEFENKHCVKMIERKNQVISSLSSQIDSQVQEKNRLEEEISKFDEDTKRLHRNYINNRDNIACLKNTMTVMTDHMSALSKQLSVLQIKTSEESKTFSEHLSNYTKTRDEYMAKYRAFPMALTLEEAQKVVMIHQEKVKEMAENKNAIVKQIDSYEAELSNKVMTRIVVKIVQSKFNTQRLENEIHECVREKTILLEQLRELQKFKQQDLQETESNSNKVFDEDINVETNVNVSDQQDICNKIDPQNNVTDEVANMCIEDSSFQRHSEAIGSKNDDDMQGKLLSVVNDSEKSVDIDPDGDVTMMDSNLSSHCYDQSAFNDTAKQWGYPIETTKCPTAGSSDLAMKNKQGAQSDCSNKMNLQKSQIISHKENSGLGKPRLSVPRLPSISRISPALRVPSLTVPRPSRVQQPRIISLAQRKILPVPTPDFPQIKQPTPPPPRLRTPSISMPLACGNSLKGNLPQSKFTMTSLASLYTKQLHKTSDNVMAQVGQREGSPGVSNVQHQSPLSQLDTLPAKDVGMVYDEEKEHGGGSKPTNIINSSEIEENSKQAGQNNKAFTSTLTADEADVNEENEPLFRLDHTFGSQGSLGKSMSSQKSINSTEPNSQCISNVSAGLKSDIMNQLSGFTFDNPISSDTEGEKKDTNQKSFFSLFNTSQKSAGNDDANDPEEGEGFGSVFNLMNFTTDKSDGNEDDNAATTQGWSGASGLLGMITTENNSTEELSNAEPFSFNFGLPKGKGEESGNQSSFFNFGGHNYDTDYTEKPIFNLF